MNALRCSPVLLLLAGCALWNALRPLSSEEERRLGQYRTNARQYYEGGRYAQALQQAQKGLEIDEDDEYLLLLLGWIHLRLETRDDIWAAERYFERVGRKPLFGSENRDAVLGHGLSLRRQGDFLDAAAALALQSAGPDPAKSAAARKTKAESERKYAAAAERLERALELNPEGTDALDALQQIYALQGEIEKSVACGRRFIEIAAKSRPLWERQLLRTDISTEEEKLARAKVESNRRREVASHSLAANCLFKLRRFEEAKTHLDALLTIDPERPEEYFNRALCKEGLGDLEGAVKDLEVFLRKTPLGFESPQVRRAYDLISQFSSQAGGSEGGSSR